MILSLVLAATVGLTPIPRSQWALREFRAGLPCPATGLSRGSCPGWQIDHVTPLKCGGSDAPANMQWLTIEQHKAKTAREAKIRCRPSPGLPQE